MTHSRPRASNRIWIGFTTPSCSDAKRLTLKPSATWKEASSAAGSSGSAARAGADNPNTKHQTTNTPQIPKLKAPRDGLLGKPFIGWSGKLIGQLGNLAFPGFDQRDELFHLGGEPADLRIAVISAAGLLGPVTAEESPILWTPVIEPEPVLRHDHLANAFKRRVGPDAIILRRPR